MGHDVAEDAVRGRVEDDDPVSEIGVERVIPADVVSGRHVLHRVSGPAVDHHPGFEAADRARLSALARVASDGNASPSRQADACELAVLPLVAVSKHPAPVQVQGDVVGPDDDAVAGTGTDISGEGGVLGDRLSAAHRGGGVGRGA